MNNHIIKGDYVLTPIENAFNAKTSYWISKKGYSIALYAFSADNEYDAEIQIKEIDTYITMFKQRAELKATLTIKGHPEFITKVTIGEKEYSPNEEIPYTPGDIVVLHHSPERFWDVFDSFGNCHRLGDGETCNFVGPSFASGKAELFIRPGMEDYHYEAIRLDRSSGWITEDTYFSKE